MASSSLGAIGGIIGKSITGSNLGGSLGRLAFSTFGASILNKEPSKNHRHLEGSRITELNFQQSNYGHMIPIVYGTIKLFGNIIWASQLKELPQTTAHSMGGKGGKTKTYHTTYDYMISLAIGLCEGPINKVTRIWADGRLLDQSIYDIKIYKGNEDQGVDPTIESEMGIGKTPAYRGLAYVVLKNLHLIEFGNRIPEFSFEISKVPNTDNQSLENLVTAVNLIPGGGEFAYDTKIQQKLEGDYTGGSFIQRGYRKYINKHSIYNKSNFSVAIDSLQNDLPKIKWTAPIVGWFVNNLSLDKCEISPGVESHDSILTKPDDWKVMGLKRQEAYLISKKEGRANYGGTPSDSSILNMIEDLQSRGLKIMLYPMLFVDLPSKPWRGKITGSVTDIKEFFNKPNGYNQFILHYANLVKGKVDAFIIGSELIGITKLKDKNNRFPAVLELVKLAKQVKDILGSEVVVTYAADWSEYHHTDGGWYNLDPLWACDSIDVVGIDAYFPLTEGRNHINLCEKAYEGWDKGEHYDYYYADSSRTDKLPLSPEYAIKNITWWWDNIHYNPDGAPTLWKPKQKKIWFTEYGFPSINCATNQPNVFFNSESIDSSIPYESNGAVDFTAQRAGIIATEKRWLNSPMVENKFLWTWDARPYPEWPEYHDVWSDGNCWHKGHWVQGKVGILALESILADLCNKANLPSNLYQIRGINQSIYGIMLNKQNSCKGILTWISNILSLSLFESKGQLKITSNSTIYNRIPFEDILCQNGLEPITITKCDAFSLPNEITIQYISQSNNYQLEVCRAKKAYSNQKNKESINIPMVLDRDQARSIAENILNKTWHEKQTYSFFLPIQYCFLSPGNIIEIEKDNVLIRMRINKLIFGANKSIYIEAKDYICDPTDNKITHITSSDKNGSNSLPNIISETNLEILDIGFLPNETNYNQGRLLLAAAGISQNWKGAQIYLDYGGQTKMVANIFNSATMGKCLGNLTNSSSYNLLIDRGSKVIVNLFNGSLSSATEEEFIKGKNLALIGDEVVQFKNAKLIKQNQYELSYFIRNKCSINNYRKTEVAPRFVLLDSSLHSVNIPNDLIGGNLELSYCSNGHNLEMMKKVTFLYKGAALQPLSPVHLKAKITHSSLKLTWHRRTKVPNVWRNNVDVSLNEEHEEYIITLNYEDVEPQFLSSYRPSIVIDLKTLPKIPKSISIKQFSTVFGEGEASTINL